MKKYMDWQKKLLSKFFIIRTQIDLYTQLILEYSSFGNKNVWQEDIEEELMQVKKAALLLQNELKNFDQFCEKFKTTPQNIVSSKPFADPLVNLRHDLRTPVNGIKGNNEIILEILEEKNLLENSSQYIIVSEIVNQILKLIDQIGIDFSLIGPVKIDQEEINVTSNKNNKRDRREEDKKLILVVDDAESNCDLLTKWLIRKNYNILIARDGEEAMRCLHKHKDIDVILLDIIMPKTDGYQVLNLIKQDVSKTHIPVIMISAIDDMDSIVHCIEAGAEDYLIKPFNSYLLDARIKTCIDKKETRMREKIYAEKLEREAEYINSVINTMNNMLIVTDKKFIIQTVNKSAKEILGYTAQECLGKSIEVLFKDKRAFKNITRICLASESTSDIEVVLNTKSQKELNVLIYHSNVFDSNNKVDNIIFVCRNISHMKKMQEQLLYQATHDLLTGLPNRALLNDKIKDRISNAAKMGTYVGVVILDLDNFKYVNDTFGHAGGDVLLQKISERIRSIIRKDDTILRFGGDEFVIILSAKKLSDINNIIRRYIKKISEPLEIKGHPVTITSSVGVSVFPKDGNDVETLLKKADLALYEVKGSGRDNIIFYLNKKEVINL